jgi:crotonobetainyl-CoA:carnitine CoA-transferase CaiB-like acyl-CoA transferase
VIDQPGPLAGIRVVDLSTVFSGPITAALRSDQGAAVIKVESEVLRELGFSATQIATLVAQGVLRGPPPADH